MIYGWIEFSVTTMSVRVNNRPERVKASNPQDLGEAGP